MVQVQHPKAPLTKRALPSVSTPWSGGCNLQGAPPATLLSLPRQSKSPEIGNTCGEWSFSQLVSSTGAAVSSPGSLWAPSPVPIWHIQSPEPPYKVPAGGTIFVAGVQQQIVRVCFRSMSAFAIRFASFCVSTAVPSPGR